MRTPGRTAVQIISTGGLYGAERALLELAAYLQDKGWRSHIVALEGLGAVPLVKRANEMGLSAQAFESDRVGFFDMARRLRDIVAGFEPGIIHSHGYKPDILLAAAPFARKWIRISTCHTWYRETWRMRLWESIDKRVLRYFDAVVAVSGHLQNELLESGVPADRVTRINNGINTPHSDRADAQAVRNELKLGKDDKLVIQIGRLTQSKRNDLLIKAAARFESTEGIHVAFVGDGEERDALVSQARSCGIEGRVHFLGYRSDAPRFLNSANALAITSDHEGLPIVLLEAMAIGCPIVSTAVGAIPDVLSNGHSAWLVPPNDPDTFAVALAEACNDLTAAAERVRNARALFEQRHSRDSMGAGYLSVYDRAWEMRKG